MNRQSFVFVAVVVAMLLALPVAAEPITLSFALIAGEEEMPAWQGIVDAWNAQSDDVKVEIQRVPAGWDGYREQMLIRVASGTSPDIGRMGVALMPSMIEAGALIDLAPYADRDPAFDPSLYFPPAIEQHTDGEHMWGMPISVLPVAFFANVDLFGERGLALPEQDWEKAWDWDEWRDSLRKISHGMDPNRTYGVNIDPWIERSIQYFWQNGVDILNEDRTASQYNDPRAVETLTMFWELWHQDRTAWTDAAGAWWGDLYHQGRLGMFADGPWMIPWVREAPYETAILPMPQGPAGSATINFIDAYVVFKGSKHPEVAWEVVRFFTEQAAVDAQIAHGSTGIPARFDLAMDRISRQDLFPGLSVEDQYVWLDAVNHSRGMPFTPNWSELVNSVIGPQTHRLFNNEISPEEAAQLIHELLNAHL